MKKTTDVKTFTNKRIKRAGIVSFIYGLAGLSIGLYFFVTYAPPIIFDYSSLSDKSADYVTPYIIVVFLSILALALIVISLLLIVGGIKLYKGTNTPKKWLTFMLVIGVLSLQFLVGLVPLIFGLLAISSLDSSVKKFSQPK